MTHIQISTYDSGFLFAELVAILLEASVPILNSIFQSIELLARVRDIGSDKVEFFKLDGKSSSFLRMLLLRKVLGDCKRQIFAEDSNA